MVIWLDDLERFLGSDGLDVTLLHRICPPGRRDVSMVATIRQEILTSLEEAVTVHRGLDDHSALLRPGAELIRQLPRPRRIAVGSGLSPTEQAAAAEATDPRVGEAAGSAVGFGEYLIAGQAMMRHWSQGEGPLHALGSAVVSAAVDCRRAGYHQPIPAATLQTLASQYLPLAWQTRADLPPIEQALGWASRPLLATSSCLTPHEKNTYKVVDYLLDRTNTGTGPLARMAIASSIWPAVIAIAHPAQAFTIGIAAYSTGSLDVAEKAFTNSANAGNTTAMTNLGVLLEQRGELVEAEQWYQRAADLGEPAANYNLGLLLKRRGELVEAEQWYQRAADLGEAVAMNNLGVLLELRGELVEAEQWFRRAADLGEAVAMNNLGVLLELRGELVEAEQWFRRAADLGEATSMHGLGVLLELRGELVEAEPAARRGGTGAMNNLGVLLELRGELVEAEQWYRRAADLGEATSMHGLGLLLGP